MIVNQWQISYRILVDKRKYRSENFNSCFKHDNEISWVLVEVLAIMVKGPIQSNIEV